MLLFHGTYSTSSTNDPGNCQVYHHTHAEAHNTDIDDDLDPHDHAVGPFRLYVHFDGSGGIDIGDGDTSTRRRLIEFTEGDFEEGFLQNPRR